MKNTEKILYFAYGTNLNKKIFLKKYKNAKYLCKYILKDFELVFRSKYRVPDIQRKRNSNVKGIIYEIDEDTDEIIKKIIDSGHSRYPVLGNERNEVIGILLAKDIFLAFIYKTYEQSIFFNRI